MDNEKEKQIAEIKKQIAKGEIEKALERLLTFLERHSAYLNMHSDALQALSQYRRTEHEAAKGTISYEEARRSYSKITDLTLNLLKELQQKERSGHIPKKRWPLIVGIAALILTGSGLYWWLASGQGQGAQQGFECPPFEAQTQYSVLVFPFYAPDRPGKFDVPTSSTIATRLSDFGAETGISISSKLIELSARILKKPEPHFPLSKRRAEKAGDQCHVRLVVWGLSEGGESTKRLTTSYKFLFPEGKEGFNMAKLELTEQTEVREVKFLSSIITGGEITEDIENVFKYIAGIIAHETGDNEAAIAQLEGLEVKEDSSALMRDMILADSYLRSAMESEAVATYDRVLETHPDYWLGWHNRGLLYLKKGDYEKAIEDISRRLELKDTDTQSLVARGQAYLATEKLTKARQDLEKADSLQPGSPVIQPKLEKVQRKINVQEDIRKDALNRLQQNTRDTGARHELIQADLKLGYIQEALQNSEALLENETNKKTALRRIIGIFEERNEYTAAQEVIRAATRKELITNQEAASINRRLLKPERELNIRQKE